ncbi:MAG: cysteine--tRNA ligase [Pseudomonadota bacterium]
MKLYNTLTKTIEAIEPIEPGKVRLYACGPTVYNYAHIGNLRTYIYEDVLVRTLRAHGYDVTHVMNITDVGHLQSDADSGEDKMALAAKREQKSPWDIARHYENEFFRHAGLLNIEKPDVICRATEHIKDIIDMVSVLVEKDFAYESGGNVYFDVDKFPAYTEFANLKLDAQLQTDRVEFDNNKRNQADFALWFSNSKFPNQIMKWDSPWGVGFPGWHIECSAMASKYLGEKIDIHCGGIDHVNVHHTNEIAQSECAFGHQWVNHWFHCEFLTIDAGKMSKSEGGFITVDTLVDKGVDPMAFRYLSLTTHYRSILSFSYEALEAAANALSKLKNHYKTASEAAGGVDDDFSNAAKRYRQRFDDAMGNDLHTPKAVAELWAVARDDALTDRDKVQLFDVFSGPLGLDLTPGKELGLTPEQEALIEAREAARANKDWAEADRIRDLLTAQGVELRDKKA